ncbi:hypothetical protein [uncultured Anaerovibrio sp.]|uniref:hypothetical protein n=1 Tax=uncultured Anaerovibrio sp. TaxID=361586 RepID=UPI0026359963|nr:hypothetical protein [uncultured Anaerovibrio sp.]
MSDAAIKKAVNDTDIFMMDFEERLKYINRQMAIMDYNTDMRVSREEGRAEGRTEGEKYADRRTAMNMLKAKEPIEKITKYTSLTEAEIQELAKEI